MSDNRHDARDATITAQVCRLVKAEITDLRRRLARIARSGILEGYSLVTYAKKRSSVDLFAFMPRALIHQNAPMDFNAILNSIIAWAETNGLRIVFVFLGAWILNRVVRLSLDRIIRKIVKPNAYATPEAEKKREDTLIRVFGGTFSVLLYLIVAMMILAELGVNIGPLLAGAGVAGLAFGFGAQYLIRDVITGLFVIMENQYRVGDVVCLDGTCGQVEDITLRMTILRDLDGTVHHIPNGTVSKSSNLSKDFARVNMNIGVSYHADIEQVTRTVNRVGQELADDPAFKDVILKPLAFLRIDAFDDSAVTIKVLGDVRPLKQWDVAGEFRKRLKAAFDAEGIEIPFPQRVVHLTPAAKK